MRKSDLVVLLFVLGLTLFSLRGYAAPSWSSNFTSPLTETYSSSQVYSFNITWTNNSELTNVYLENNFNGSLINDSMPGTYPNYTYSTPLAAGVYQFRFVASESDGSSNATDIQYLTINQAPSNVTLYLNGSNSNLTVRYWEPINITAITDAMGSGLVKLSMNATGYETNFTNGTLSATNITSNLPMGVYGINASYDGDDNYSSSSSGTLYLFVTNLNFSNNLTYQNSISVSSPVTYSQNSTYNFTIKLSGNTSKVFFEADFNATPNFTANNDASENYWINFNNLSAGSYHYRWFANDTNNVSISTDWLTYMISSISIMPSFKYGANPQPWITINSENVTLTCTDYSHPVIFSISGPCLVLTPGNPASCVYVTPSSGTGWFNYTCLVNNDSNYVSNAWGNLSYYSSSFSSTTNNNNQNFNSNQQNSASGSFIIKPSESSLTVEPGSSNVITLTLDNTLSSGYVLSINVSVSGIDSTWYSLDKTSIAKIKSPGSDAAALTLNVPSDAEVKTYVITVTASGKDFTFNPISMQTTIKLNVSKEESPTNLTEENSETANQTLGETSANATNQLGFLTGLSINSGDFRNVVLFVGLLIAGLVFIFRSNITSFIKRGKAPMVKTYHRYSFFYSVKDMLSSLGRGIAIRLKRK